MNILKKTIVLTPTESSVTISPNGRRTFASFNSELSSNVSIALNDSSCLVGDELIVSSKVASDAESSVQLTFSTDFVYTACGSNNESENIVSIDAGDRWLGHFWFNGDKFINYYDNC